VLARLRSRGHAVSTERLERHITFTHEIDAVADLNRHLAARVREAIEHGAAPVVLAGDCTACLGTLAGVPAPVGIVWLDAHGDFNTPDTTVTGFLGGMPLAAAVGRCWTEMCASIPGFAPVPEDRVVLFGVRALDPREADLLHASAIHVIDGATIRRHGIRPALEDALTPFRNRGADVYVHLDLDVLDPGCARANRYAEPGGLTPDEIIEAVRTVGRQARVRAAALTAYDPGFDADGRALAAGLRVIEILAAVMRESR